LPALRTSQPGVRRQPQRTCIACRDTGDKRGLTRLVRGPDGHVSLDATGRTAGRGAYLCSQRQCWERALGRADVLGRALKVSVPPDDRAALMASAPADEPIDIDVTDNQSADHEATDHQPAASGRGDRAESEGASA
jgi:predicted RNA-binding protein YlxR (DUF448 family)